MIRILFSSAGRRVELINCFKKAALELGVNMEVVAIDMDPSWSPACQVADYAYKVPHCLSSDYLDTVLDICRQHEVDLIIPTIDTELINYAENKALFFKKGIDISISSADVIHITRDKEKTARVLSGNGIPVPMTRGIKDIKQMKFPVLVKPRDGSCSKGIAVVNSEDDLKRKNIVDSSYIAQEICHGREFTINCFYDTDKGCVACVPHFRKFVRSGEVCFAETKRIDKFKTIAEKFHSIFPGMKGCICFQGFLDDSEKASVFEINARFGGGYPICDAAGGTFAKWIIQNLCGITPDYNDDWIQGMRMLRYDAAVFINNKD
jgi:carbamoyl-phosphate synthase large subunit